MTLDKVHDKWIVLAVRIGEELSAYRILQDNGYEVLLPRHNRCNQHTDPCNGEPLFPGYCILRFDATNSWSILRTPGVLRIVSFGGTIAILSDDDMSGIRVLAETKRCKLPTQQLEVGTQIRVVRGPLTGLKGMLVRAAVDSRIVVQAPFFNRNISIRLDSRDAIIDL